MKIQFHLLLVLVWCLVLLLSLTESKHHASYQCFLNTTATNIQTGEIAPKHLIHKSKHVMPKTLHMSLSTFKCQNHESITFDLDLKLFTKLYHRSNNHQMNNIQFYVKNNSKPIIHKPKYRSYLGHATVHRKHLNFGDRHNFKSDQAEASVSLTFSGQVLSSDEYNCHPFSANIWTDDTLYQIVYEPNIDSTCPTMIVHISFADKVDSFTANAMKSFSQKRSLLLQTETETHTAAKKTDTSLSNRKLQQIVEFEDCFTNQYLHSHSVSIGLLVDNSFYNDFGSDIDSLEDYIQTVFTHMNGIYEAQLNIYLKIGQIFVGDVPYFYFNDENCQLQTDINTQRSLLKTWMKNWRAYTNANCTSLGYDVDDYDDAANCNLYDNHAVWVLLSKCSSGGLTYQGSYACLLSRNANIAVVNGDGYDYTWKLLAHEIAHQFDASENSGSSNTGLMNVNVATYNGIYQFHDNAKSDLCDGIQEAMNPTGRVPHCWSVEDYDTISYRWRQTGEYQDCYPCGNVSFAVETLECVMNSENSTIAVVDDVECNPSIKPWAKYIQCSDNDQWHIPQTCNVSVCGNGYVEYDEECDSLLDSACCDPSDCTYDTSDIVCSSQNRRIDAAFTDTSGKLYLFQGSQFAVYESMDSKYPESGYPMLISEAFPMTSSEMNSNIDAAFCTPNDVVYIFKDSKFIAVDLSLGIGSGFDAQIEVDLETLTKDSVFGKLSENFRECEKITSAFVYSDAHNGVLVCNGMYYIFDLGLTVLDEDYDNEYKLQTIRPFWADFDVQFSIHLTQNQKSIDAAAYDYITKKVRFYLGDQYVDYANGIQIGSATKITPMGYWSLNLPNSTQCDVRYCEYCSDDFATCYNCENGYNLHNNYCYTGDHIAVIKFDTSNNFGADYIKTQSNVQFIQSSSISFEHDTIVEFFCPTTAHGNNGTFVKLNNWQVSLSLYPTQVNSTVYTATRTFLTLQNSDYSRLVFEMTPNSNCNVFSLQIYYQNRSESDSQVLHHESVYLYDSHLNDDSTDCSNADYHFQTDAWNKLTVKVVESSLSVVMNDVILSTAVIEDVTQATMLQVDLFSWWIGAGYIGDVSYVIVKSSDDWNDTYANDTSDSSDQYTDETASQCVPSIPVESSFFFHFF